MKKCLKKREVDINVLKIHIYIYIYIIYIREATSCWLQLFQCMVLAIHLIRSDTKYVHQAPNLVEHFP